MSQTTVTPIKKRQLDSVDVAKFILSIMIVCLHIRPLGHYNVIIEPFLRTAVPLFFMIGAYFFFGKQMRATTVNEKINNLEKFVKRNLQLYAFWFVALLIPTAMHRDWFAHGILNGIFRLANNFMFHSTFIASWYIMASIIATVIIVIMSRYLSNKTMLCLFIPIYAICCLMSNYCYVPVVQSHMDTLAHTFSIPFNSFWVALFWVLLGKMIAENEQRISSIKSVVLFGIAAIGLIFLGLEQYVIVSHEYSAAQDCFFMLPLVCIPVMLLILRVNIPCKHAPFMRAASVITYCLHDTLYVTLCFLIGLDLSSRFVFVLALVVSWLLTIAILKAEKQPKLTWLRFAH